MLCAAKAGVLLSFLTVLPGAALACDCQKFTFEQTANVVRGHFGRVVFGHEDTQGSRMMVGEFTVDQVLKGEAASRLELETTLSEGECGVPGLFIGAVSLNLAVDIGIDNVRGETSPHLTWKCSYYKLEN